MSFGMYQYSTSDDIILLNKISTSHLAWL